MQTQVNIGDTATDKIDRLAKLKPEFSGAYEEELFKVVRGFMVLDWVLRHPNDLGKVKAEAKFEGLLEKAAEVLGRIQAETEEREALRFLESYDRTKIVEVSDGE
jgi:hypothetical protein